jgi:hypothetical protein
VWWYEEEEKDKTQQFLRFSYELLRATSQFGTAQEEWENQTVSLRE